MVNRLSHGQKETVRQLLLKGLTVKEVEKTLDYAVSLSSIKRIKKGLPQTKEAPDTQKDYTTKLTKKELQYAEKIKKEIWLYEDEVEGWTYHITETQKKYYKSSMWFNAIAYPESAPEHWKEKLTATGLEWECALHDKDSWEHDSPEVVDEETGEIQVQKGERYHKGDPKKLHYHITVKFPNKVSWEEANELIRGITNGPYIQKCFSLRGSHEYKIHLNNPERFQYDKDDIERYNGFTIEPDKKELKIMLQEVYDVIKENEYEEFADVVDYYNGQIEYINMITEKAYAIQSTCTKYWRAHQRSKDAVKAEMLKQAIANAENKEQYQAALENFFKEIAESLYKQKGE